MSWAWPSSVPACHFNLSLRAYKLLCIKYDHFVLTWKKERQNRLEICKIDTGLSIPNSLDIKTMLPHWFSLVCLFEFISWCYYGAIKPDWVMHCTRCFLACVEYLTADTRLVMVYLFIIYHIFMYADYFHHICIGECSW